MTTNGQPLTLMAVHAHPDDEVLSTGGILARYAAEGVRTVLVTSTYGEVGEINDPSVAHATPEELGQIRIKELEAACRILHVSELRWLGYRDSGMAGTEANNHPASYHQAPLAETTGRLVKLIRELKPQVLVTYDENGGYGHPDHIKAHQTTVAAFSAAGDPDRYPEAGEPWQPSKLYFGAFPRSRVRKFAELLRERGIEPPWARRDEPNAEQGEGPETRADNNFGQPDERVTTTIDITDWIAAKREALAQHRTQISPDFFFMKLPEDLYRLAFSTESFIRAESYVDAPLPEDDLFAGLREGATTREAAG